MAQASTLAADGDDEDTESGITELEKFSPDRVDGVVTPASGFPVLMIKAAGPQGGDGMDAGKDQRDGDDGPVAKDDGDRDGDGENALPGDEDDGPDDGDGGTEKAAAKEAPLDPDGADAVRDASPADREAYLGALKAHRATEPLGKGAATGTEYLQAKADWRRWSEHGEAEGLDGTEDGARRWLAKHGTGPALPAAGEHAPEAVAIDEAPVIATQEAAEAVLKAVMAAEAPVYKRDIDTETRRKLAGEGKALPNLSYPIENTEDLENAATLARSGHGDVAAAKRLIARRAKELGAANPLEDKAEKNGDSDGDADDAPKGKVKCPTCKGEGKIRDGGMTCPKCKGKGFVKPGKAAKAAVAAVEVVLADGLISEDAAQNLIAQINEAAKAAGPGARPLPATTQPVPAHREPDGTTTVEQLEPDAGLPTDHDATPDKVPASVDAMGKAAPYEVTRMHDALCAAYGEDAVLGAYPAVKSSADAVDPGWFTSQASELLAAQPAQAAVLANLAAAAQAVKAASGAAVADAMAEIRKAFTDMYPDEKIRPQSGIKPGSYQRPYLSAGHAAASSGNWTVNVPPSSHVPEPGDYQRGYLSAGHAAPSPADHGPNNPSPPGSSGHEYYSTTEKDMAAAAMRAMHDHIAATFAGTCPMAPARTVLPPQMGATNTPSTTMPHAQGGVTTVKAAGEDMGGTPVPDGDRTIRGNRGMGRKKLRKALEEALRAAGTQMMGPAEIEALVASKLAPIAERHHAEVAKMQQQIDELGKQPDPAMAPVRGQMARAGTGTAVAVQKRSLFDEASDARKAAATRERADLLEYVTKQAASPDPNVRERARAFLDQLAGEHVPA